MMWAISSTLDAQLELQERVRRHRPYRHQLRALQPSIQTCKCGQRHKRQPKPGTNRLTFARFFVHLSHRRPLFLRMHRVHRPTEALTRECGCCIGCGGRTGKKAKSGMADVTPTGARQSQRRLRPAHQDETDQRSLPSGLCGVSLLTRPRLDGSALATINSGTPTDC